MMLAPAGLPSAAVGQDGSALQRVPSAHDLIWLADATEIQRGDGLPAWADAAWLARAPLVVRRQRCRAGRIPVGLRGLARSQRHPAEISSEAVARVVRPEDLAADLARRAADVHPASAGSEALAALALLAPQLDASGLVWGPTGGVGFALASGLPVLRVDSDLDLLVRAPRPLTRRQAKVLLALIGGTRCRLDIQVDTGAGAFALAEWLSGRARVLLKTDTGPVLCEHPWAPFRGAPISAGGQVAAVAPIRPSAQLTTLVPDCAGAQAP